MDCLQLLAKSIVERMDELGWLVPKTGATQPNTILPNLLSLPQLSKPSELTTAEYENGLITVDVQEGQIGVTYEVNLIDTNGKMKVAPHIALYVAQKYYLSYKMKPDEVLYVTLVATKKGSNNSELTTIPVKFN